MPFYACMGCIVTVSGAVGGIGTSTFAYALALQAVGGAVLIDAQTDGCALDALLGLEQEPGTRWSQVRIRSDEIEAVAILQALPKRDHVAVLSADGDAMADPRAVGILTSVLAPVVDLVVVDVPLLHPLRNTLQSDLRLLLTPPTVLGVAASLRVPTDASVIVVETGSADFAVQSMRQYLPHDVRGRIRWQRPVTAAAAACQAPPDSADCMRVAAAVWRDLHDGSR